MTMPTTNIAPKIVELPEPRFPMLTRMISNPLFPPESGRGEEPITWGLGTLHPLVAGMKVVRMFVDRGGVEVYSVSQDGNGMRNLIPMHCIRLIEEAMPLDVFVEELAAAESPEDDDDPEDDEQHPDDPSAPAASNGQNAVTS